MKNRILSGVSLLVATCALGAAGYSSSVDDPYVGITDGALDSAFIGAKTCGAQCSYGWVTAGWCYNSQSCCGWVNCDNGTSRNTCCSSGQHCVDGRQTTPPSTPRCLSSS